MITEHTDGPWKSHVAHELLNVVADSVVSVHGLHVADVASYGASIATRNANARLIASAPKLLAALEEMLDQFGHYCEHTEDPAEVKAQENARAALALAKGEGNA
jgi:hypothetical protein